MAKVTAIKKQVKQQGRFSVFIDDKYSFSLSELALFNSGIKIGQEINKEEHEALKDTSKVDKAYNRVLALLARRPRSKWEVSEYLRSKGYSRTLINEILNKLTINKLIDDNAFAKMWVDNRRLLKPISKRRLQLELKQKRISQEIIDEVLAQDETDELEVLKDLINRKRKQSRYQDVLKLTQYLARQGFSYDLIKTALNDEN